MNWLRSFCQSNVNKYRLMYNTQLHPVAQDNEYLNELKVNVTPQKTSRKRYLDSNKKKFVL